MNRSVLYVLFVWIGWTAFSQTNVLDISFDKLPIDSVFSLVTKKTGYYFSYNSELFPQGSKYSMTKVAIGIDDFLNKLLIGTGLQHQIMKDQIIIKQKILAQNTENAKLTFSINGQVRDSLTLEPISGANVFLSGTNLGGVTDLDGYYMIDQIPLGSYEVIFSHVTFGMRFQNIELKKEGVLTVNQYLKQESRILDTLRVVSRRLIGLEERERFVRIFKNEFLGRSQNADQCELVNPEVLDFIYDPREDKLEVFALEPVEILNEHLGYRITYYFDLFQKSQGSVNFFGKARFVDMIPTNKKEERKWLKNRLRTYQGSFLHFRRSLVEDNLRKDQFKMTRIPTDNLDAVNKVAHQKVERKDVLKETSSFDYELDFEGYLMVTYRHRADQGYTDQFFDAGDSRILQRSLIKLNEGPLILKENGRMEFPGMSTFGYWYWERIADLLPENYDPNSNF